MLTKDEVKTLDKRPEGPPARNWALDETLKFWYLIFSFAMYSNQLYKKAISTESFCTLENGGSKAPS